MIDINIGNSFVTSSEKTILNTSIECLIQQVDMLFGTDINDVLGDEHYGTNYDRYLYTAGMSNAALESKILADLNNLNLLGFSPSVKVTLLEGTVRDIALIELTFKGDYDTFNKIYRIE